MNPWVLLFGAAIMAAPSFIAFCQGVKFSTEASSIALGLMWIAIAIMSEKIWGVSGTDKKYELLEEENKNLRLEMKALVIQNRAFESKAKGGKHEYL